MKKFFLLIITLYSTQLFAQRVDNIYAEQKGNKLYVYYDLDDNSCCDRFDIALFATLNGDYEKRKLREVSGDVGHDIRPGRENVIVWDVLDEIDELENVRFYVQAKSLTPQAPRAVVGSSSNVRYSCNCDEERTSYGQHDVTTLPGYPRQYTPAVVETTTPQTRTEVIIIEDNRDRDRDWDRNWERNIERDWDRRWDDHDDDDDDGDDEDRHDYKERKRKKSTGIFMTYNASERMRYGGRIGRLAGIGSYMSVRVGNGAPGAEELFSTGSFMVGPTLRIIKTRPVKVYVYGGAGYGKWYLASKRGVGQTEHIFANGVEYEWGGIVTLGRLTFTGGMTTLKDHRSEATFGLGLTLGSKY